MGKLRSAGAIRSFLARVAWVAAGYLVSLGGVQPAIAASIDDAQAPIVCGHDQNQNQEVADCLRRLKDLVTRDGDSLRLGLGNGRTKLYQSHTSACAADQVQDCVVFQLERYYPSLKSFLVSKTYYECGNYELVSRGSGRVLEISTIPEFSPGGKHLVSADDSDACPRQYDLAIWSTKTDPPSLEFRYQADQYENWTVLGWEGDDVIKLSIFVNARDGSYDQDARAIRSEDGWKLVLGKRVDRVRQDLVLSPGPPRPQAHVPIDGHGLGQPAAHGLLLPEAMRPATTPIGPPEQGASRPSSTAPSSLDEPKRIRTVIVRPDPRGQPPPNQQPQSRKDPNSFDDGKVTAQATSDAAAVALLYEEDPHDPWGRRVDGSVVWSAEVVSPGAGQPPEVAVRADIEIPERKISLTWILRHDNKSNDSISYTIEIMFKLAPDSPAGGIFNVPGVSMKRGEQTRGTALAGNATRVATGYFLVGLSNAPADREGNVQLLKEWPWLDIPIVFADKRRAILALEKGTAGERAFAQAFAAWGN